MKTPDNLVIRLDKLYQQVFVGNSFSYIVIVNLNVLTSGMKYWIGSQGDSFTVITAKEWSGGQGDAGISQELSHPI